MQKSRKKLLALKEKFQSICPEIILSVGDTPSVSVQETFNNIDELRPGNFIFYDLMQLQIGSCKMENIALRMKCIVISKNKERKEIVIHGGAIHFSKDYILNADNKPVYGQMVTKNIVNQLFKQNILTRLSQEHGVISADSDAFHTIQIGDVVEIIPCHSCLTMDNMGKFYDTEGHLYKTLKIES